MDSETGTSTPTSQPQEWWSQIGMAQQPGCLMPLSIDTSVLERVFNVIGKDMSGYFLSTHANGSRVDTVFQQVDKQSKMSSFLN